jgi:hypothetical protein
MCGKQRTLSPLDLEVWQGKEIRADFSDVWQGKDLDAFSHKSEVLQVEGLKTIPWQMKSARARGSIGEQVNGDGCAAIMAQDTRGVNSLQLD